MAPGDREQAARGEGEPLLKSVEELDAKLDAEAAEDDAGDDAKKSIEDDPMISEGAFVLIDYVNQTRQVASIAQPKSDNALQ